MRFGFYSANFNHTGDPRRMVELAVRAEAGGWDGVFLWDHLVVSAPPVLDPWVTLGAIAARTERIALGPLIVPLARRRAQKVALEAVTLARLAPGRFVLGVGLGAPQDFTGFGEEEAWRVRAAALEEALPVVLRAAAGESLSSGAAYVTEPVSFPVWVGTIWPRRREVHGAALAHGVFPTVRREDGQFEPPAPDVVRELLAFVPERARRDCALWSWNDTGAHPLDEYERAGVTWWMKETWGLEEDELFALADAGPTR